MEQTAHLRFAGSVRDGLLALVLLTAISNKGHAIDPAHRQWGPVFFEPLLYERLSHEDNIFNAQNNSKSSWILKTNPRLKAWLENGFSHYDLGYELINYQFFESSDDDITDHRVWLDAHHEFNSKNALNVTGEYLRGHERRGEGLTEGSLALLLDKPIKYDRRLVGGAYTLGNVQSDGRLVLEYGTENLQYKNFRRFTQYRDRSKNTAGARFFYRVAQRTDALMELRYVVEDYDRAAPGEPSFSSDEWSYLAGLTWAATGKTSGTIKLGGYERNFDAGSRGNYRGFRWDVLASWFPKSYSAVNLRTSQYSQETNGLGDFVQSYELELGWNHDWNGRTRSEIEALFGQDDYQGIARKDERWVASFKVTHAVDRWLDVGGGYRYDERDSNEFPFSYVNNIFFVEFTVGL